MLRATYTYSTGLKSATFCLYCRDPADISLTGDITDPDPDTEEETLPDTVWAGGKDTKDKNDASKSVLRKTMTYQCAGKYSGGKWCAAVTSSEIDTVEKFVALFDEKGKVSKGETDKVKNIVKAKIKDGTVTITSGKAAGTVNVWVYELKKDAKTKKTVVVNSDGIAPMMKTITIRMASNAPVLAESLSNGVASSGVSKLELKPDESKTLLLGDKKTAFDSLTKFKLENSDESVASAKLSGNELTVKALKEGKTTITLTCVQSGKKVKLTVTCKAGT